MFDDLYVVMFCVGSVRHEKVGKFWMKQFPLSNETRVVSVVNSFFPYRHSILTCNNFVHRSFPEAEIFISNTLSKLGNLECAELDEKQAGYLIANTQQLYVNLYNSSGHNCAWAFGLVGYDTAFTRRRSPVRIRQGPLFYHIQTAFQKKRCYL